MIRIDIFIGNLKKKSSSVFFLEKWLAMFDWAAGIFSWAFCFFRILYKFKKVIIF